ncbi:hypothetical protein PU629_08745 [Pullulanibacillus sp. KACC 23026]|nr:hypothetical protein [Pullulanibacillus sp. KACC 23026]WEG14426.1 hypothetical protein PU629_08745 [Pullulanibacillus sp. KACC 23026]
MMLAQTFSFKTAWSCWFINKSKEGMSFENFQEEESNQEKHLKRLA